jgi:hypothetical protein
MALTAGEQTRSSRAEQLRLATHGLSLKLSGACSLAAKKSDVRAYPVKAASALRGGNLWIQSGCDLAEEVQSQTAIMDTAPRFRKIAAVGSGVCLGAVAAGIWVINRGAT